ncbi:MAG: NosD domain-containing protein, partial [Candidatus Thermoplasmatota archaeon]
ELRLYPHESICIDGNSNFLSKNSGVIAGLGTADSPYIIEGWEIDASRATGIEIRNTNAYFVIYGCKIHSGMDINHHGIYLHNVSNARIENVILEANHFGIYARNCNRITINHCKMYDNSHNGINIWHSLSVEIANCLSYQNVFGISFVNTSESSIANCILYNNTYGILLTHTSDRNLIATSRIYNNFCGVCFADLANSNTLRQCELYNNTHGVFLNRTADNKIYHNNFINNSNQSFDNNANYWDNGYPSGGNYWSDYDGVDANGDGIGDSPYYIPNATGKDDYPLIRPVDITIPEFEGGLFVEVKLDNDLWQLANGAANWNFIWNTITVSNGWHTIYARAYDGIAYSEIKFVNVYVDNPIPEIIFFAINNGALYTNSTSVTLTLLANNATYMHFSNDNITWSDWLSYASTTSWELPSGDGIKVVYAQVVSSVGIPSVIVSDDITLDTTPPEITDIQAIPRTQTEGGWVNISCKVVDNIGVAEVRLNIAGPTPFTPVNITMTKVAGMDIYYFNMSYSVLGNYSFYIWANDTPSNQNKSAVYYFEIIPTP